MKEQETIWPKKITVDRKIVKILSESTYDSFPHSLKEIIVNSYDAESRTVNLSVDIEKEIIIIEDNGNGMTANDFDFYLRIAGQRREKGEKTNSGRPIIGQFGVGFLSVFPFFLNYHIETKKAGISQTLFADIPCYKYFGDEKDKHIDISLITINGGLRYDNKSIEESFTRITLTGFTKIAHSFFEKEKKIGKGKGSIMNADGLDKLKWFLEDDLPLKYDDETFSNRFKEVYEGFPFDVIFNKKPLKRRVFGKVLMDYSDEIQTQGNIKYRYFICSNDEPVNPPEATGIKIRVKNIGVGKRTTFGIGVETGGTRSRLRWVTGEIHILGGLDNSIKVSRDDFTFNEDYDKLKVLFSSKITKLVSTLEAEKALGEFLSSNTIKDLRLLEKKSLSKKIEKVKTGKLEKPQVKISDSNKSIGKYKTVQSPKEEIENVDIETYEKKYKVNGKVYIIKSSVWDFNNDQFPACKMVGNVITINKKYPLFSKQKHLDIFIRFNILLLIWLNENNISSHAFSKILNDLLYNFSDNNI